ncbi:MAG: hypothetical protein HUU37_02895 [Bdellovibrionales bacterium]|nr:hypothetical protein [Bdellovibrionales bacterium]
MKEFLLRYRSILLIFMAYAAASKVAHTLLYTLVSSWVLMTSQDQTGFSDLVNEIASQFVFAAYAAAALLLALAIWLGDKALYSHRPFWNTRAPWRLDRQTKSEFGGGFGSGFLIAAVLLAILLAGGYISYLGLFLTSTVGTPVFPLFFSDLVALMVFVVCEEFLFRHKILPRLLEFRGSHAAVWGTAFLYVGLKQFQFQLVALDFLNLMLLNLTLGYYYLKSGKAHRGLGLAAALFGTLHAVAGMPLWSQTSPSLFLFKHNLRASDLMSGGAAGPMASLGMTLFLFLALATGYRRWRRDNPNFL